jgi:uncharacterized protein (TIRG00374 family)
VGKNHRWLLRLFGLALFIFVLTRVDLAATWMALSKGRWGFFFLAVLFFVVNIGVKTGRWRVLLSGQGIDLPFAGLFAAYLGSSYIGLVTPGRVGEFVKAFYVKNAGHSLNHSLVSALVDRALDLVVLLVWGYLGVYLYARTFGRAILFLNLLAMGSAIVLGVLWWRVGWRRRLVAAMFDYLLPERFRASARLEVDEFVRECRRLSGRTLLAALSLSVGSWLVYFGIVYLLALTLDIRIDFFLLSLFFAITSLLTLLPVSVSGIGTRDAALVYLFGTVGLAAEEALAISLLVLALMAACGLVGLLAWLRWPIQVEWDGSAALRRVAER